jgi:hypothetical protein
MNIFENLEGGRIGDYKPIDVQPERFWGERERLAICLMPGRG